MKLHKCGILININKGHLFCLYFRHMQFLLHQMNNHLTDDERREMASMLESYTAKTEGTPVPLVLNSGIILPPVPFTRLPLVRYVTLYGAGQWNHSSGLPQYVL